MKKSALIPLFVILCMVVNTIVFSQIRNTSLNHPSKEVNWLKRKLGETSNPKDSIEIYHGLSQVYFKWGKTKYAIESMKRAVAIAYSIDNSQLQYEKSKELANLYVKMGDYNEARDAMMQIVKRSNKEKYVKDAKELIKVYAKILGEDNIGNLASEQMDSLEKLSDKKDALEKKRDILMAKIDRTIEESKDASGIVLKNKLDEIFKLKDSLMLITKSYDSLKLELDGIRLYYDETIAKIDDSYNSYFEEQEASFRRLQIILIAVIFISLITVYSIFKIKSKQKLLVKQKAEIEEQSVELQTQNEELQTMMEYLKKTQNELVKKEQMASLGKLMAGIAHEINTPLGAINSSIETVLTASEKTRENLPELVKKVSDEEFQLLLELLNEGLEKLNHYTAREERAIKKILREELKEMGIVRSHHVADNLIDIGIHTISEKYKPLFNSKHWDLMMKTAYNSNIQVKNGMVIKRAVHKASKIIFALKHYSFTNISEEMVLGDVVQSIESVLTIYHNQLKQKVRIEKEFEELPKIMCYPDELSQVWINLITNSLHAMEGKGVIRIAAFQLGNSIEVSFSDDGPGIPDEIKDRVFDPFFTTKAAGQGTGLGLDIIKKIIEKHDGDITFSSKPGKGTTFRIHLPVKTS